MRVTVLAMILAASAASFADDEWVAVGQVKAAKPAAPDTANTSVPHTPSDVVTPGGQSLQAEMLSMIEIMQQEIAELRGTVEEQQHQLEQMRKLQQQRYLDLDSRVADLLKNVSSQKAQTTKTESASQEISDPDEAYASAIGLIREKQYDQAIQSLSSFTERFSEHPLAANAAYWRGEVYLVQEKYDDALREFTALIEAYPESNKVPDASYKQAVVNNLKGDPATAKKQLKALIERYKDDSSAGTAVKLSERYLQELGS